MSLEDRVLAERVQALREQVRAQYGDGIPERVHRPAADRPPVTLGPDSPIRGQRAKRRSPEKGLSEHDLQAALFAKINDEAEQRRRPDLATVYAIPNGASASSLAAAARRKAEGQRAGVSDVHCPCAHGGYIGLWIEMKRPGQATTAAQADWLYAMAKRGHMTRLHTTTEGAWAELIGYLDLPVILPSAQIARP